MNKTYFAGRKSIFRSGLLLTPFILAWILTGAAFPLKALPRLSPGLNEITLAADVIPDRPGRIPVTVYIPEGEGEIRGDILVLPGWNHSRHRWLKETPLLTEARKRRFRLVAPEMGKTVYASRYFPETHLKWGPLPGLEWIQKILLPEMNRSGLLEEGNPSFLLGFSTGGRGVAQLGLAEGHRFSAAASLSGDYAQELMPRDNLMTAVYGSYSSHEDRWKWVDNPGARAKEWKIPLFLAHGQKDRIVPFEQTRTFYETLVRFHPDQDIRFSKPADAGHDYTYLTGQLPAILDFFEKYAPR